MRLSSSNYAAAEAPACVHRTQSTIKPALEDAIHAPLQLLQVGGEDSPAAAAPRLPRGTQRPAQPGTASAAGPTSAGSRSECRAELLTATKTRWARHIAGVFTQHVRGLDGPNP